MALLAWRRHLRAGQDAFAFLWRRTHTEQQVLSPPPIVVCCCLLSKSSHCRSFEENSGYFPRYVTNDGVVLPHGDCKWIVIVVAFTEGGLYSRESAYSKISPLPSLGHVYCWKRGGGGLFSGGYGNIIFQLWANLIKVVRVICACAWWVFPVYHVAHGQETLWISHLHVPNERLSPFCSYCSTLVAFYWPLL